MFISKSYVFANAATELKNLLETIKGNVLMTRKHAFSIKYGVQN